MSEKGFTLAEMLIVIVVLSIIGVLILSIFTSSLRGSNKSNIIVSIKQNGQSVLENMSQTIRNSDNVVCPVIISPATTASSDSLVVVKNGIYTRYRFIVSSLTSNGLIQRDSPIKQFVSGIEETNPQFVDRICGAAAQVYISPVILTDTNSQSGVSVENGLFTRDKSAGFMDTVSIKFNLLPGKNAPQAVAGQIDPVQFTTTIQLR